MPRPSLVRAVVMLLALVAAMALAGAPSPARADWDARGFRHNGLLIRLSVGAGFNTATLHGTDPSTTLSGVGGMASFAFGGIIADNLALNADLFAMTVFEPKVSVGDADLGDAKDTTLTIGGLGVGATYYIMPINMYFAASVGVATGTVRTKRGGVTIEGESDPGFGASFMIGKEWWVGRQWGLGVAAQAILASLPDKDDERVTAFGIGILFSATYN
ncbi:MAG: hypothetical protein H6745_03855 [Deltaproteobacteria bacterium]|nr:hypothetical protein [Deltaproteobacteria bacterium]